MIKLKRDEVYAIKTRTFVLWLFFILIKLWLIFYLKANNSFIIGL